MRDYHLHEISNEEFEYLVCQLCHKILGCGTISFSEGPDGGRDAKFEGVANNFPSEKESWKGKFIIQAKKHSSPNASCSHPEFNNVLKKELPKIQKLKSEGEIDNYILFTNRKFSGRICTTLINLIKAKTRLQNVEIIGKETLTRYLDANPEIVKICKLEKFREPLRFNSEDVKIIITAFHKDKKNLKVTIDSKYTYDRFIDKEKKNELNKLSRDYFEAMKKESLAYFEGITKFLKNPRNREYNDYYSQIANELQFKFIARREDFDKFDEIFSYVYDFVLDNHPELKKIRRLINVLLHYMYWYCDFGKNVGTI